MNLGLTDENVLVVGGSSGIGLATARILLEEGARTLVCSRSRENLDRAATEIERETGRRPATCAADITRPDDVAALATWTSAQVDGALDVLVSCVGGSQRKLFEELSDEEWLANYEFNVLGTVRVVRAFLPLLRKSKTGGRIVILGAASARQPHANQIVSNVHKAGLLSLTKTLANELAGEGIRVNSVCPGRTLTSLWTKRANQMAAERGVAPEVVIEEFAREIPMGRFGRAEEAAAMVVFLASQRSSYITGQSINVDGGIARGLL
jgi:3-oxoacyl-[acyl-carrier protein] reductase